MRALQMRSPAAALLAASVVCGAARAQQEEPRPWSLDLTVHDFGIGIGNSRHIDGLRLNLLDHTSFVVYGLNVTLVAQDPHTAAGTVNGIDIGLLWSWGRAIRGVGFAPLSLLAEEMDGVGLAVMDLGGTHLRGVFASLFMVGNVDGVAGSGILAAGYLRGVGVGGAVIGKDLSGLAIGAVGIGAVGSIDGLAIGGLAVATSSMTGVSVGAFNYSREQRGLAIGLFNYSASLHGVQIGLVNWADNNPAGLKVLPVANAHFE